MRLMNRKRETRTMNTSFLAAVSIILLLVAWRWWQELDVESGHTVCQGILLAIITIGWFLRIVSGGFGGVE